MAGLSKQQQQQQQQDQQQQDQQQQQQPAVLGDPDPAALTAFMEEAKATYALGKQAIAKQQSTIKGLRSDQAAASWAATAGLVTQALITHQCIEQQQ
jgi:hypothetical protein